MISAQWLNDEQLSDIRRRLSPDDALLFDLLLATGFRLDDVLHARWRHLADDSLTLTLREAKTGKFRTAVLPRELVEKLRRRQLKKPDSAFLFPAQRKGAKAGLHRSTYWRHFAAAAADLRRNGVDASPHSLRKVYAVRLFKATKSLESVRQALNHSNIATTALYALSDALGTS